MKKTFFFVGLLFLLPGILPPLYATDVPRSSILYWESQPGSQLRDTTLIRLYAKSAELVSEIDSSLAWLHKGYKVALNLHSYTWLAYTHNQIGKIYLRKGVTFNAIEYFFKGLQYAELANDTSQQAFSWDMIGDCYADLKDFEKATSAETKAKKLYKDTQNLPDFLGASNDLSAILRARGLYQESLQILEEGLQVNQEVQNPRFERKAYFNLAATYLNMEKIAGAEKYGLKALALEQQLNGRANAELLSLLSLIKSQQNAEQEALNYAGRAELYLAYEWPHVKERVAFNLYETYKYLNYPDSALQWYVQFVEFRDNAMAEGQKKRIETLRYEYDAQQRDAQMQVLEQDMVQQSHIRNGLILGIIIFLLLVLALFRINSLLRKRKEELDHTNRQLLAMGQLLQQTNATLETRVEQRTRELMQANRALTLKNNEIQEALIRGQSIERKRVAAELHNNLGSLLSALKWRLEAIDFNHLSPSEEKLHESVVRLITDAYNQVRHISHNLMPSILEKKGLMPALEKLVNDLNRTGKAHFELNYPKDIHIENNKISFELYSCVLELVNNILKHANARQVVIEIVQTERFYIVLITDDGVGIPNPKNLVYGNGLENILHRINSLQGHFSIYPMKNEKGTTVTLRIPRKLVKPTTKLFA
ncbi:tetratricopeptide repeat-containing sensor histidine kinase [Arundinibacter roseus]|uniref:histidine kinase n=1 Tax=Arundinibacter roseus TaxID=2070510 RepID=A0A4R4KNC1_9BACT|nr:ATP-binding protein [Arundinibacter roseus]TDB68051.1 hypothetical protein EZE20_03780 [Arundinibacter roseus]